MLYDDRLTELAHDRSNWQFLALTYVVLPAPSGSATRELDTKLGN
jgi:hypothetical protein